MSADTSSDTKLSGETTDPGNNMTGGDKTGAGTGTADRATAVAAKSDSGRDESRPST